MVGEVEVQAEVACDGKEIELPFLRAVVHHAAVTHQEVKADAGFQLHEIQFLAIHRLL